MKELNNIETLIIRSLDKTASEKELTELKTWLNVSEQNKQHYFSIKDVWDSSVEIDARTKVQSWSQIEKQVKPQRNIPRWSLEIIKIAAVAIIVAFASYAIFQLPAVETIAVAYTKVTVPNGSQTTVELADGTIVNLNAGSELTYPTSFNEHIRQVKLSGEGYFSVHHDKEHPFVVSVDELEVRVLGTEFNVMAYPGEHRIETTLVEGSVSMNKKGANSDESIILKPGQQAVYENGKLAINTTDVQMAKSWVNQGLNFQSASFKELAMKLQRWYNVDIVLSSELADLTFTGKFRNKESIWQVLDVIKMTTPIDYNTKNDKIYITLTKN